MLILPVPDPHWIHEACEQAAGYRGLCESTWADASGRAFAEDHLASLHSRLISFRQELDALHSDLKTLAARCPLPPRI